jgi:hypothetical protein
MIFLGSTCSVLFFVGWVDLENPVVFCDITEGNNLRAFPSDTTCQLDVLGHDRYALGVDGTQVCIFKKTHKVRFGSFLKSKNGRSLESKITLEVLGDFTDQSLKWKLADEQVSRFLVTTDFTKGNGSRSVSVRLFDASGCRRRLAGCLGSKLFARSLSSGGLASGLLCTSHFYRE